MNGPPDRQGCSGVRLTLLRHGESTYNAEGRYQGTCDLPELTPIGRAQAIAAAAQIDGPFDRVFASPLKRALQTAEIVDTWRPDLPAPQIWHDLREISLPAWEGRRFADVRSTEARQHREWKFSPSRFVMHLPDGTTFRPEADAHRRAARILSKLAAMRGVRSVLVITHGGLIRALLVAALGMQRDRLHTLVLDNCSKTVLQLSRCGRTKLVRFNMPARPETADPARQWMQSGPSVVLTVPERAAGIGAYAAGLTVRTADDDLFARPRSGTVLATAPPDRIRALMEAALGLSPGGADALGLRDDTFHVLHPESAANPASLRVLNGRLPVGSPPPPTTRSSITELC